MPDLVLIWREERGRREKPKQNVVENLIFKTKSDSEIHLTTGSDSRLVRLKDIVVLDFVPVVQQLCHDMSVKNIENFNDSFLSCKIARYRQNLF